MTTATSTPTTPTTSLTWLIRAASRGAVAGVIASLMMAAYAMISAATYQGSGFFTPLYHIASTFISPDDMMSSMKGATGGSNFEFFAGPAILGALIHMMVGAMYGVGFGVLASLTRMRGMALVAAAVVWGGFVFVISSFVGLPLAAAIFNSGDQITNMAELVGYGTFLVEHLIFGLFLGLILLMGAKRAR